jgi:quinol monooxygenase YgiN
LAVALAAGVITILWRFFMIVIARLLARPGKETELQSTLLQLLAPSRAEVGCRGLHLYQSTEDKRSYVFHSQWATPEDFAKHLDTTYVRAFLARTNELLDASPDVTRWEIID